MKPNRQPYFSALKHLKDETVYEPEYRFEVGNSVAFVHDIMTGLPDEFKRCDVFYSEPPFPAGMKFFNAQAGKQYEKLAYSSLMRQIGLIASTGKPMIVTNGLMARKHFPVNPDSVWPIRQNGDAMYAYFFNMEPHPVRTTNHLIYILSSLSTYNCVGDFCCGYGNIGLAFHKAGKSFVMSDYNPRCIGYIKKAINENL